jgi:hydrophobic/amphiphilic exporter-1 (mainly G- bacteria), HAE1 family
MNLANVSIRRPVFATMLIAAFMVFGLVSYKKVGVDLIPNIEFPFVIITVTYPGTDPVTMERDVGDKIEEAVNSLGGIRNLKSYNLESVSMVFIEFELEVKADLAIQDVREKVSRIQKDLPAGADPPLIEKFDPNAAAIMSVALSGDLPIGKLTHIADKVVKERLQRINGVGSVEIIGGRDREIQVFIDPDKLNGLGLTVQDVAQTIAGQNLEIPAGTFKAGSRELTVKTKGQLVSADDVANIVLPTAAGAPGSNASDGRAQPTVRISDVGRVVDGVKEARSTSMLDGKSAVSLDVKKQTGANTVAVAEAVEREMEAMRPILARDHCQLALAMDTSGYIKRSIEDVGVDLILGAGLTVAVIFLFLINGRATLISAIALPTSVVSTFAFIYWMGFTFNNMTMLALSLAIGVLVDDAIVVMENIHRHLEMGKHSMDAASDATNEIFLAVVSMTSTILAVFVPVAIMKGIVGRFFMQFGLTVSFAVAMSLLVSFTLTPMMSSRLLTAHNADNWLARSVDASMSWLERVYGRTIRWALAHRWTTVTLAVVTLVGSFMLVARMPKDFFPKEDRAQFSVNVELPTGTNLEATNGFVQAIAEDLRKNAYGVVHTLATVGGGRQGQVNKGTIQVMMTRSTQRKFSQEQVMKWTRSRFAHVDPAKVTVSEVAMFGGGNAQPIQLSIRGRDLDELARTADLVKLELQKHKGFVDVDTTYRSGKPEVALQVDRERAAALGVPVASIALAIRSLMAGDAVSELKDGTDAYDIIVQLPENDRNRVESLSSLKVRSTSGQLVDLANVVKVTRTTGPTLIEHSSRQRQVTVLANLDNIAQGDAQKIVENVAAEKVPKHLEAAFEGMGRIMAESFGYMGEALILAVVLVYMILAAQFNSFIQPITIMMSLPLSVIGAFGALSLLNMTLSMYAMIGIIMLMGLVTKNAILIVDFANQARERGTEIREALVQAGSLRLRPILMTTVSLLLGMSPVALALGEGGEARAPMAVCVMGGMIASTVLTLVIVPVIYTLFDAVGNSRLVDYLGRQIFVPDQGASDAETSNGSTGSHTAALPQAPGIANNTAE